MYIRTDVTNKHAICSIKNLELKAKCSSLESVRQQLVNIKAEHRETVEQIDTYFNAPKGRVKLREIDGGKTYLVYYERPNAAESRFSTYQIWDIPTPAAFKEIMSTVLGVKVTVEKLRELWLYGDTRIHLDRVANLGEFVELETAIRGQTAREAWTEHHLVKDSLGILKKDLIAESYSDLFSELDKGNGKEKT